MLLLNKGQRGRIVRLDVPEDVAYRLMLLGFVPGAEVEYCGQAPGGDPRLFRVDGIEVALRRETAEQLIIEAD